MEGASTSDPDVDSWGMVLRGLHGELLGEEFQARDLFKLNARAAHSLDDNFIAIREGLAELLPVQGAVTVKRIGMALARKRDRIVGGLVLRQRGQDRDKTSLWAVERHE